MQICILIHCINFWLKVHCNGFLQKVMKNITLSKLRPDNVFAKCNNVHCVAWCECVSPHPYSWLTPQDRPAGRAWSSTMNKLIQYCSRSVKTRSARSCWDAHFLNTLFEFYQLSDAKKKIQKTSIPTKVEVFDIDSKEFSYNEDDKTVQKTHKNHVNGLGWNGNNLDPSTNLMLLNLHCCY